METEEETVMDYLVKQEAEWNLKYLRNTRNSLLHLTDKYLMPDYPISPENLEIIKSYRQELRDIINVYKDDIINNGLVIDIPPIPQV